MILIDVVATLFVFVTTVLGSAAFLSIAFVDGTSTSRVGGAIVARRTFAVTMIASVFLFAIPILYLLGVYSEDFARQFLSWTLSAAVAWNGVVLPLLMLRLAIARFLLHCMSSFSARRFSSSDVHVLRRSGVLPGDPGSTFSKSLSNSKPSSSNDVKEQSGSDGGTAGGSSASSTATDSPSSEPQQQQQLPSTKEVLAELRSSACSGLRDAVLARMALIGACCVAALAGFAAVSTPIENLFPFLKRNSASDAQTNLNRLQRRLQHVLRRWGSVSQEGARLTWQLRSMVMQQHHMTGSNNNNNNNNNNNTLLPPPVSPQLPQRDGEGGGGGWFLSRIGGLLGAVAGGGSGGSSSSSSAAQLAANDAASRRILEQRLNEVHFEIAGYQYLASNLFVAIDEASATLEVASMGKSRGGKLRALLGIGLSLFGAAKVINLLVSVTLRRLSGEDAATVALRNFVRLFGLESVVDVSSWASRIALVLNMCLVLSAVRGFLILMFRLTQSKKQQQSSSSSSAASSSAAASDEKNSISLPGGGGSAEAGAEFSAAAAAAYTSSSWWHALLFGGPAVDRCPGTLSLVSFSLFMGLHFLGAFVLLRLGFPARSRSIIIDAVGTVPFVPCHAVHDVSFLVAVVATMIVLKVLRTMDETAADDDDDAVDDFGV